MKGKSRFPNKVEFWQKRGYDVQEKRGWVRVIISQARQLESRSDFIYCMKQVGWQSLI